MYTDMEQWEQIRRRVLREGVSKRQILRETGIHWKTLEKMLSNSSPPGYRRTQERKSILDVHSDWILGILDSDKSTHKKQRHTVKRIFERLQSERNYKGKYSIVRELVANLKKRTSEVYMPLLQPPGEAQVDYFQAVVNIDGVLQKAHCFAMSLVFSDMFFVKAFPRECTESFWEGHVDAFRFFGGIPKRISYDNSRIAIQKITGCHGRILTDGFLQLKSHYLFDSHFCCVRRPNEKGVVENIVRYARLNFMVPVPQVKSFDQLNKQLWEACNNEQHRKLLGKGKTKRELWLEETPEFLALPEIPFDPCRKTSATASSLSLVRFKCNDYSIPVEFAHHELILKAYVDTIHLYTKFGAHIATHKRSWLKHHTSYDPRHYLKLLSRKPGALDYAQPLMGLKLPESFDLLRKKLELQLPERSEGTRDYIKILQLLEKYSVKKLGNAIEKALRFYVPCFEIIHQYCMDVECPSALTFNLDGREHLASIEVYSPNIEEYETLTMEVVV